MSLTRLCGLMLLAGAVHAADLSFSNQIAPLLAEKCVECHRQAKAKGGYRLDTFEVMSRAGDSGSRPVTPGKPGESEVYKLLVTADDGDRMPKKADPLSKEEIDLIKRWIAAGAEFDGKIRRRCCPTLAPGARGSIRPPSTRARCRSPPWPPARMAGCWPSAAMARSPCGIPRRASLPHASQACRNASSPCAGRENCWPWQVARPDVRELWLVNAAERKPVRRLLTSPDAIQCLAMSPDGKLLAAGGIDNHVRLFELPAGRLRWDVEGHADWVMALAFSPDGQMLASASRDRTARLFAAADGEIKATHTAHTAAVLSVAFTEDGSHVFSGAADGEVHRWNMEGASEKGVLARPTREGVLQLLAVRDRLFASLADKGVVELDPVKGKALFAFTPGPARVDAMALLPEPPTLVTGAQNGEVRFWDLKEKKQTAAFIASPR